MGYTYKSLVFNENARKASENTHRVRYDSYSTELWGSGVLGRDAKDRYILGGTDTRGKKVSFYISKKVLDRLKPGHFYSFKLSGNLSHGYYHQEQGPSGFCKTLPRGVRR